MPRSRSPFNDLFAPGAAFVHRLKLSDVVTDTQSRINAMRNFADAVPDAFSFVSAAEVDSEVALIRIDVIGHTPEGGEVLWSQWGVTRLQDGRSAYSAVFDLEDEELARATFVRLADERVE